MAPSVVGSALFLRYSLTGFLRFWLARQSCDLAHANCPHPIALAPGFTSERFTACRDTAIGLVSAATAKGTESGTMATLKPTSRLGIRLCGRFRAWTTEASMRLVRLVDAASF